MSLWDVFGEGEEEDLEAAVASKDYPVLAEILVERPPLPHAYPVTASLRAQATNVWDLMDSSDQARNRRDRAEQEGYEACVLCGRAIKGEPTYIEVSVDGDIIPSGDPRSGGEVSQGAWAIGPECRKRVTGSLFRPAHTEATDGTGTTIHLFRAYSGDEGWVWASYSPDDEDIENSGVVGALRWDTMGEPPTVIDMSVAEEHQRKGIGTLLFEYAKTFQSGLEHSDVLTGDGRAFRDSFASVTPVEILRAQAVERDISAEAGLFTDILDALISPPPTDGRAPSFDWCRFRRDQVCYFPTHLNQEATRIAGYEVWVVKERGICPRYKWKDQEACPISEPGPNSNHPRALIECTRNWEDGGQRDGVPGPFRGPQGKWPESNHLGSRFPLYDPLDGPPEIADDSCPSCGADEVYLGDEASLFTTDDWICGRCGSSGPSAALGLRYAAFSPTAIEVAAALRTSAWSDVRAKAAAIRREGGVKVIAVTDQAITAEVKGHSAVYQTTLHREPGTRRVSLWECSCPWAAYSWDRSGRWKRFEGRMCAHALALTYEAQSQEFGGGTLAEDPDSWSAQGEKPTFYEAPPKPENWMVTAAADTSSYRSVRDRVWAAEGCQSGACNIVSEVLAEEAGLGRSSGWFAPRLGRDAGAVVDHYWNVLPDGSIVDATGWDDVRVITPADPDFGRYLEYDEDGIAPPADWVARMGLDPANYRRASREAARNSKFPFEIDPETGLAYLDGQVVTTYPSYHPTLGLTASARTLMYRSDEHAMTLCPRCYKRQPDEAFRPIKNDDPSLRDGIEICSDCGRTIVNRLPKDASLHVAEIDPADPEAGMREVEEICAKGDHTHSGLVIKAVDSGRLLLTQRTPYSEDPEGVYGRWEFPGGSIGEDEAPFESAVREFREETGLELPEGWRVTGCYESGPYIAVIVLVPNEGWTTNAELLDFETMGIGWFHPDQIEDTDLVREEMESADWEMVREARFTVDEVRTAVGVLPDDPARGAEGLPEDGTEAAEDLGLIEASLRQAMASGIPLSFAEVVPWNRGIGQRCILAYLVNPENQQIHPVGGVIFTSEEVVSLAVLEPYRRRGVARDLLERADRLAGKVLPDDGARTKEGEALVKALGRPMAPSTGRVDAADAMRPFGSLFWSFLYAPADDPGLRAIASAHGIVLEQSPLDYHGVRPKRLAIRVPGEWDPKMPRGDEASASYFTPPNSATPEGDDTVAFLDFSERADSIYIHFMAVRPDFEGKGLARLLVEHLYAMTDKDIDWGRIMSDRAEALWRSIRDAHPDRWNRARLSSVHEAMADRSGVPEVDALIEEFLRQPGIADLRDPANAHGQCAEITEQFVAFAKERGFKAYVTDTNMEELGYQVQPGSVGGEVLDDEGNFTTGHYFEHTIASIYLPGQNFPIEVDFTASQYGYTDHPKVLSSVREAAGKPIIEYVGGPTSADDRQVTATPTEGGYEVVVTTYGGDVLATGSIWRDRQRTMRKEWVLTIDGRETEHPTLGGALFAAGKATQGKTAVLHDEPEPALPIAEGAEEDDEVEQRRRMLEGSSGITDADIAKAARQHLAAAVFSPKEQMELIEEGDGEVEAANLDRLMIEGTHYEALQQRLESAEDLFW